MNSSLFIAGVGQLRYNVKLSITGTVLVGMGRVKALARALSTIRVTRRTKCHTIVSRESKRARSSFVTSLTITYKTKRVGANTPYHSSQGTGCGRLLQVRRRLKTLKECGSPFTGGSRGGPYVGWARGN